MTLVLVEHVLSSKAYGVIFAGRTQDGALAPEGTSVRIKANRSVMLGEPAAGESWSISGRLAQTRWGPQIEATAASRALPSGVLIREYLAKHVPGIGPDRAERLWKAYGRYLPEILVQGDVAALAEIIAPERPVLGPRLAGALVRAWREADAEARLVAWLQNRGVEDTRIVRRIATVLGPTATERLKSNPWALVAFLPWERVDALGLRLYREADKADPENAPNRLVGAVDAAMKEVIASGATAVTDGNLRERLAGKLEESADGARVSAALEVGIRNGAAVRGSQGTWRAPGCAAMESALQSRLGALAAASGDIGGAGFDVHRALERYSSVTDSLHPEQKAAILRVLGQSFACLQGGAGVGKTHVAKAICAIWEASGGDVLLATISGKAALRLSRSTGRLAKTLFRTLRELRERAVVAESLADASIDEPERQTLKSKLAGLANMTRRTLVVVDEASMVDLATLHALVRLMPNGARLLLIGDERQLPPVSFGLVFHKVVDDPAVTARLTIVHRQTGESGIPAVAEQLRMRAVPVLPRYPGVAPGVSLLAASDPSSIADGVLKAYADLSAHEVLIVAPTNEGVSGVNQLNRRLHDIHVLAERCDEIVGPLGERFAIGEPVAFRRNDYNRGLFNGSMGRIVAIDPSKGALTAVFDTEEQALAGDDLVDLSLGYALTCHRAQGSQAARVIVALTPSRLLDPAWLYTAVTRAEEQVVLVGAAPTLESALLAPWAADRRLVGFDWPCGSSRQAGG